MIKDTRQAHRDPGTMPALNLVLAVQRAPSLADPTAEVESHPALDSNQGMRSGSTIVTMGSRLVALSQRFAQLDASGNSEGTC